MQTFEVVVYGDGAERIQAACIMADERKTASAILRRVCSGYRNARSGELWLNGALIDAYRCPPPKEN